MLVNENFLIIKNYRLIEVLKKFAPKSKMFKLTLLMIFCILAFASAQRVFFDAKKTCPPNGTYKWTPSYPYCVKYADAINYGLVVYS